MKSLLNSKPVQKLIAILVVGYLKFCYHTSRWTRVNQAPVEAIWAAKGPVVLMFWHGRLHLTHACWPLDRAQAVCVLASLSKSGDQSALINQRFGYHAIRGSSAKKSDPTKQKGGAQAFREMLRWMRAAPVGEGRCVAMTPDGPRGPHREMTEGTLKLSQMTGAPMITVGLSTSRFIEFKTWDRMRVPLPFGHAAIVWEVHDPVPADIDADRLQDLMAHMGDVLTRVNDEADRVVGAPL
ncbi:lysophospholipid acyltransferase family protein [Asticcacaulis sp. ZE23SCel15]|uniref:lysophospholipid acyltransferase family protein n=1 Tax=Asticcacaulis sp. ZE23SCel15 TaxID=3059027 RepID=UPI00265E6BB7|nr:lysophospholipid acyltransferase family protein [Asticcacaulis sp. ZE23SCel15]WKL57002.1 lysophospholipid acyltransferase family protein [Asticcacaulis sp. ZE23SCel15]